MSEPRSESSVNCPRCKVYVTRLDPPQVECTGHVHSYQLRRCVVCNWQQWECVPHEQLLTLRRDVESGAYHRRLLGARAAP